MGCGRPLLQACCMRLQSMYVMQLSTTEGNSYYVGTKMDAFVYDTLNAWYQEDMNSVSGGFLSATWIDSMLWWRAFKSAWTSAARIMPLYRCRVALNFQASLAVFLQTYSGRDQLRMHAKLCWE